MNRRRNTTRYDVIVVGAGYAGLLAANRVSRHHSVLLVNDRPDFVDRIRLHEYVAGRRDAPLRPLSGVTRRGVDLAIGSATRVACGSVELSDGRTLSAAQIIVAVGSIGRDDSGSHSIATLEGAERARQSIGSAVAGTSVIVRGGGLTGIELVTEIADARPDLRLTVRDRAVVGGGLSEPGRMHLMRHLDSAGVATDEGEADPGGVAMGALSVDCTGFHAPSLPGNSNLPTDVRGRLLVAADLSVPGHPGIWGAGDAVAVEGWTSQRMGCALAEPMGAHAADNVRAALRGHPARTLRFAYAFRCLSLGRRDGIIQWVSPDDTATMRTWTGRPAARFKECVSRFAVAAPYRGARAFRWKGGQLR